MSGRGAGGGAAALTAKPMKEEGQDHDLTMPTRMAKKKTPKLMKLSKVSILGSKNKMGKSLQPTSGENASLRMKLTTKPKATMLSLK